MPEHQPIQNPDDKPVSRKEVVNTLIKNVPPRPITPSSEEDAIGREVREKHQQVMDALLRVENAPQTPPASPEKPKTGHYHAIPAPQPTTPAQPDRFVATPVQPKKPGFLQRILNYVGLGKKVEQGPAKEN